MNIDSTPLCMCCESGNKFSGIICIGCEEILEQRKDTFNDMVMLVLNINRINEWIPPLLQTEAREKVMPIYEMLCQIKIEDTRGIL